MGGATLVKYGATILEAMRKILDEVEQARTVGLYVDANLTMFSPDRKTGLVFDFVLSDDGEVIGLMPAKDLTTNLAGSAAISIAAMYHEKDAPKNHWIAITHAHT